MDWVRREDPDGIPTTRVTTGEETPSPRRREPEDTSTGAHRGLFSGSPEAEERGLEFTQSIQVVGGGRDDDPER